MEKKKGRYSCSNCHLVEESLSAAAEIWLYLVLEKAWKKDILHQFFKIQPNFFSLSFVFPFKFFSTSHNFQLSVGMLQSFNLASCLI